LEELARIYGYNRFPNTLPAFVGAVVELPDERKNAKVRENMLALGYDESISITFISQQDAKTFGGGDPLALANPLSDEAGYMRTSLLPGLLNMVSYNLNRGTVNVRLFEAGRSSKSWATVTTSAGISASWPPAMLSPRTFTPLRSPTRSFT